MYELPEYDWLYLERSAEAVVTRCLGELPELLREAASRVPVIYRKWHPDVEQGNWDAVELLGEYFSYEEDRVSEQNGPVALYLGAIQLFCDEEGVPYEDEVRITFLHELGHHFGWDEDDLHDRGLG
ncbi:MAG: hypothetical protein CBD18_09260 [Opitutales bacterium TMED158]|nr:MAG: hypothetical protein CBD18_09260 [Opitutales bacterium TMED158]